jgi:hypothetical protein
METDKHFHERISRDIMERIKNLNSEELKVKSKGFKPFYSMLYALCSMLVQ